MYIFICYPVYSKFIHLIIITISFFLGFLEGRKFVLKRVIQIKLKKSLLLLIIMLLWISVMKFQKTGGMCTT